MSVFHGDENYQQTEKNISDQRCWFLRAPKRIIWRIMHKTASICYLSLSFDFVYLKLKTSMKMMENCGVKWQRLGL